MRGIGVKYSLSDKDQPLAQHIDRAIRELEAAAAYVRSNGSEEAKTLGVERDLRRHILSLQSVSSLFRRRQREFDIDALSEDDLAKMSRERYARKKQERKNKASPPPVLGE